MERSVAVSAPVFQMKAELFKALSHPARVRVLELLVEGERPVSELLSATGMEASHLSQHLGVLRRARVVTARRGGNTVVYRLASDAIVEMLAAARQFLLNVAEGERTALSDTLEELA